MHLRWSMLSRMSTCAFVGHPYLPAFSVATMYTQPQNSDYVGQDSGRSGKIGGSRPNLKSR